MSQKTNLIRPVIAQIIPALNNGGVERGTVETAQAISDVGWNPIVISSGGMLESQLKRAGAKHFTLPVNKKNPVSWQFTKIKLQKILKGENVDIHEMNISSKMNLEIIK